MGSKVANGLIRIALSLGMVFTTPAGADFFYFPSAARRAVDPTIPIPKDHALVPAGDVQNQNRTGSGNAGVSSNYKEYLPEFSTEGRPSNLRRLLRWSREKADNLHKINKGILQGEIDPIESQKQFDSQYEQARYSKGADIGGNAVLFYLALGMFSGVKLMTDYPNNPTAWTDYLETGKDAVFWASMAGFLVAAGPFFTKMSQPSNGRFLRQVPLFAAAIVAGSLISSAISKFGNDPDVSACAGFTNYRTTGHFGRDLSACDRAFFKWTGPELLPILVDIGTEILPQAASFVVTGALYFGTLQTGRYLVNRYALLQALKNVRILSAPGKGWAKVAGVAIFLGAFLFANQITESVFHVEKGLSDFLFSDVGPHSNLYGRTPKANQDLLFAEWSRIKKDHWRDPNKWNNVCYDAARSPNPLYNCDKPEQLDFEGLIENYAQMQRTIRGRIMQDTMNAYNAWLKKVDTYQRGLKYAYEFYKDAIQQFQNGTATPESLRIQNDYPSNPTAHILFANSYDGTWKYISTPTYNEYLLTSMACGPELEGYNTGSWWESTRQAIKSIPYFGNSHPKDLFSNTKGFVIDFHPPRITTPLEGIQDTVCEHPRFKVKSSVNFPSTVAFEQDGKYYHGLIEYIAQNIRPSVLMQNGGDANSFDSWWAANVIEPSFKIEDAMRAEYKNILDTTYASALQNRKYYRCQFSKIKDSGLEPWLRQLSPQGEACAPENLNREAQGIFNNMQDEMRTYLALLLDLYKENQKLMQSTPDDGGPDKLFDLARSVMVNLERLMQNSSISAKDQRDDIEMLKSQAIDSVNALATHLLDAGDRGSYTVPAGTQMATGHMTHEEIKVLAFQFHWAEVLLRKIGDTMNDSLNYYSIVTTFER